MSPGINLDLTGLRFGRLTAVRKTGEKNKWFCVCDCGRTKEVRADHLTKSKVKSCRCLQSENGHRFTTHGGYKRPEYRVWNLMKDRCYRQKAKYYPDYGGRGIYVCERWLHSFEDFLADMGCRPTDKHTLDRIDNDGPYSPENCCWATRTQQARHRRSSRMLTYRGETHSVAEWAQTLGMNKETLYCRLNRLQWTVERTLSTPVQSRP